VSDFTKGVIVMGGFMAQALGALFKENEELVASAKTLGGVAACRVHRREEATNLATGERSRRRRTLRRSTTPFGPSWGP
jgi:hypothetical protein